MSKSFSITNNLSNIKNKSLNLSTKNVDDRKYIPENFKKIARSYEKQFAQFMVEQMNKTVNKTNPLSTADQYYQSLITDKRSEQLTENKGGLGLQDLILDQIYPHRMRNELTFNSFNQSMKQNLNHSKQSPYNKIKKAQENRNE